MNCRSNWFGSAGMSVSNGGSWSIFQIFSIFMLPAFLFLLFSYKARTRINKKNSSNGRTLSNDIFLSPHNLLEGKWMTPSTWYTCIARTWYRKTHFKHVNVLEDRVISISVIVDRWKPIHLFLEKIVCPAKTEFL